MPLSDEMMKVRRGGVASATSAVFPLRAHSSNRYLVDRTGSPFLIVAESAWSCANMLNYSQMATYLDNRVAKGFNAIQAMAIGKITNATPNYANAFGHNPFTTMTDFSTDNVDYWRSVDNLIQMAHQRGILVFFWPAYGGYLGDGTEGWAPQVNAESSADLRNYGRRLGNRYWSYENLIWSCGGDYADATFINNQFNIIRGVLDINPDAWVTAHGARSSNAYTVLSSQRSEIRNFLNGIYTNDYEEYSAAATEYGRAGPIPFIDLDHQYEGYTGHTADYTMLGQCVSMLSGSCGFMFGNVPVCEFGAGFWGSAIGAASCISGQLESNGAIRTGYVATLFRSYNWHLLEPKTDTSLVTTSLGTGSGRIAPARASDGSYAMIWTPNVNFTVAMTALTPSSVRARWWNPVDGSYSTDGASPLANTGTHAFTAPGTRILVLDAA